MSPRPARRRRALGPAIDFCRPSANFLNVERRPSPARNEGGQILSHPAASAQPGAAAPIIAPTDPLQPDTLLERIIASLEESKAEDIVPIPLAGKTEIADHMVVCTGRSSRQVSAIAQKLADHLKQELGHTARTEGLDQGDWVLIDAGDVIVHVFRPEMREFYQLEKMWMDTGQATGSAKR